ncbi:MAG: sulfotransferase [Desulfovermiculus sp.]|nr:sulfotransferase [Desulfovermiculus sp.]
MKPRDLNQILARLRKWLKPLIVLGILGLFFVFWAIGLGDVFQEPHVLAAQVEGMGWQGFLLFAALFVLGGALGIPPAIFVVAAGLLWSFPAALHISFLGGMAAASLGFFLSRYVARDFFAAHIPKRISRFGNSPESSGIKTVVLLRLLFYLFPPVNWMLGLSRIRFCTYLMGSMLGALPGTIVYVFIGDGGIPWLLSQSPLAIAGVVAGGVFVFLAWRAGRAILTSRRKTADPEHGQSSIGPQCSAGDQLLSEKWYPVSLSMLGRTARMFIRLAGRTFWPPKPYPRPPSLKRMGVMLCFLPAFAILQTVHWIALLLDEVLFPDYRQVTPEAPIFVVGIPRSGTTFLHRVLARDRDQFTTLSLWELVLAPAICERLLILGMSRIDRYLGQPGGRLISWIAGRLASAVDEVHPITLQDAEEDFLLLSPILSCFLLIVPFPFAPEIEKLAFFDDQAQPSERRRVMAFYYAMVQRHLYVFGDQKIFLSKNVSFTPMLESLLAIFPQARLVACARTPLEAVPSQISAMERGWQLFDNPFTPELFGDRWLELMDYYYSHLVHVLSTKKEKEYLLFDMHELQAGTKACVQCIYERFHIPLSDTYATILDQETEAAASYRSRHRYDLEKYGLEAEKVRSRYEQWYRDLLILAGMTKCSK